MKKIMNAPENYTDDMLKGIYAAHPDMVKYVNDDLRCYCTAQKKDGKVKSSELKKMHLSESLFEDLFDANEYEEDHSDEELCQVRAARTDRIRQD